MESGTVRGILKQRTKDLTHLHSMPKAVENPYLGATRALLNLVSSGQLRSFISFSIQLTVRLNASTLSWS